MAQSEVWRSHLTPLHFLRRSAQVFGDRTAVVYGTTRYSYRVFAERVNRLASALCLAGIRKGDRVAFLAPNIPAMLEAHFAVPLAGGVLVPINTRLNEREIAWILDHSGASMLFVDAELTGLVMPMRDRLAKVEKTVTIAASPSGPGLLDGAELDYERFLATGGPADIPSPVEDEDEVISINYTSGTTGSPKGVMYTHRGAYLNALAQIMEMGLACDSAYLWTLPMFHCNGWCHTWATVAAGASNVCLRKPDPASVLEAVRQEAVTHFCAAPTVLIGLADHPEIRRVPLPRKLRVLTGGAPPSPTLIGQFEQIGADLTHTYGLTETYGPGTVCVWQPEWAALDLAQRARLKARQGVTYVIGDGLRVVDADMNDVPADGETMGEIVFRGNTVMKGYYQAPEATAEAFRGGWLHSGDLGVRYPDGYVELRDRQKDIIISGGENISTIEVERVLAQHPAVLEVAVIAIPHDRWGEVPKAYVTLKDGMMATEDDLIAFCRERLAHFKCPRAMAFGALPKTSTGKVQKFLLREKEWAGRATRIQ